jgi:hypothetical protein
MWDLLDSIFNNLPIATIHIRKTDQPNENQLRESSGDNSTHKYFRV